MSVSMSWMLFHGGVAIPFYLLWRVFWANRLPITDCDEVYNYWEALHYLLVTTTTSSSSSSWFDPIVLDSHSHTDNFFFGLQTWEYAHEYALRTYAYLQPLKYLATGYTFLLKQLLIPAAVAVATTTTADDASNSLESSSSWHGNCLIQLFAFLTPDASILLQQQQQQQLPSSTVTFTKAIVLDASIAARNHKALVFMLLRATLALCMGLAEVIFLYSLWIHGRRSSNTNSTHFTTTTSTITATLLTPTVVGWTGVLMLTSAGMNHAAGALLPSTTWMMAFLLGASCVLQQRPFSFAVIAIAATLMTGWPFGAMILAPLGLFILYQQLFPQTPLATSSMSTSSSVLKSGGACYSWSNFFLYVVFLMTTTVAIQAIVMFIDHEYYGKWTSATLNIFAYNAAAGSDALYGVEPLSYYLKNILINFNFAAPLAALAPLFVYFATRSASSSSPGSSTSSIPQASQPREPLDGKILQQQQPLQNQQKFDSQIPHQTPQQQSHDMTLVILLFSLYAWMILTFPRPHKEERFLFPMYPLVCLGACLTVDTVLDWLQLVLASLTRHKALFSKTQSFNTRRQRWMVHALIWIPSCFLSLSRTMALSKYYTAPLTVYAHVSTAVATTITPIQVAPGEEDESAIVQAPNRITICTCGEWYRYPSSFYLPSLSSPSSYLATVSAATATAVVTSQLAFVPSSFKGQLPQPFSIHGSRPTSQQILQPFNDQNQHEPERYVSDPSNDCDFWVDLEHHDEGNGGDDDGEKSKDCMPPFPLADSTSTMTMANTPLVSVPFLDSESSPALHRILYLPWLHETAVAKGMVNYRNYALYDLRAGKTSKGNQNSIQDDGNSNEGK